MIFKLLNIHCRFVVRSFHCLVTNPISLHNPEPVSLFLFLLLYLENTVCVSFPLSSITRILWRTCHLVSIYLLPMLMINECKENINRNVMLTGFSSSLFGPNIFNRASASSDVSPAFDVRSCSKTSSSGKRSCSCRSICHACILLFVIVKMLKFYLHLLLLPDQFLLY